jgi:DNA-binding SARP family transcriptional activator/DNA-binding CsgD family transcriptional regulator
MHVRLLGPVDIGVNGTSRSVRGVRRKAVLAVLALHGGTPVATDALVEAAWGDEAASVALNTLQSHVSYLRRVLGAKDAILAQSPGYALNLGPEGTDVQVAQRLIRQAREPAEPIERVRLLSAALALWRGRPLHDVAGLSWLDDQARHLDQLWLQAKRDLIEAQLALGEHTSLVPDLVQLAHDHPFDEQIHRQLILALYRAGRQADALATYHRLRHALNEDLGIDPSQDLRDLEANILRQDSTLDVRPAVRFGHVLHRTDELANEPMEPAGLGGVRLGGPSVVGRPAELATLLGLVHATARGAGGAVFLVGEGGIGKTRLAEEAARFATEAGLRVLRGRAAAPAVQFRPLAEALLSVLRRSGPPEDPELLPFRPALSRLVPEWRWDRPAAVEDSVVVLAEAVLRLAITLGRPRGCLLVLEDLHEADADTLAVVDYLVDNAESEPLLVLGTVRTDGSPALDLANAARRRRRATVLELSRLDDEAIRALAAGCLELAPAAVPPPVVERLVRTSDGIPLHIEELLVGMVTDQVLVGNAGQWTLTGPVPSAVPVSLAATLADRTQRLSAPTQAVLQAAALLGRQWAATTAGTAVGIAGGELLTCLREAVHAQLVVPDGELYTFRHALTAESLRARLLPLELSTLARGVAEAVESAPSDGWERLAGELWYLAGAARRAAELLGTAGRRAAAQGAGATGISLLERALSIVDSEEPDELASELSQALVDAYADAGRVSDAYAVGAVFDRRATPAQRAALHLRLARMAGSAGHWEQGLRELAEVRELLGAQPDPAIRARIDAVEARLTFGNPTPSRRSAAQQLAEQALRAAEETGQPDVACSALETLGRCARLRDLAEADALYQRGLAIAEANNLVSQRIGLLYHIGAHDGIRYADTERLSLALSAANQAGAVVTALNIELEMAVVQICRAEYEAAEASIQRCAETAGRLKLTHTRVIALGERIIVAAHQGKESEVDTHMARFRDLGGEEDDFASAVRGFGLSFAHLLREDAPRAMAELEHAAGHEAKRPASYLSLVHGPNLLLSVLFGRAGRAECTALARSAQAQAGWNQQFLLLAEAVLHGRARQVAAANQYISRFLELSQRYPLARHLGLRLISPEAMEHGWGDPVTWLRPVEAYFHDTAPAVARACRILLRQAGAAVPQHRIGSDSIPAVAREYGVTVREYEILCLVAQQLGNSEIGRLLFLSPRTVEKHVSNLLAKTGQPDRVRLAEFAAAIVSHQLAELAPETYGGRPGIYGR